MFSRHVSFCNIKNHGVQNHPQKNKKFKRDCFVYACPSLFNLFHFFDMFIKIFFDAITDHHCFFFFSLFFLSHGNHRLLLHINHLILCWHILLYLYTILLSLSLVSLSSLNSMLVQCSSVTVLVHLQHAPSLTIQLPQ